MFNLLSLLAFSFVFDQTGDTKVLMELEPIPEDAEMFLQNPSDLAVDSRGFIYVLDFSAQTVFVWDNNGKYQRTIGKPGKGPGEFTFMGTGGPQGYLNMVKDEIVVYDGATRTVSLFDRNYEFKQAAAFNFSFGRVETFRALQDGNYLISFSKWSAEAPSQSVASYNREGKPVAEFVEIPDKTWKPGSEGGQNRVVINAYAPRLMTYYDEARNQVIVGDTGAPSFDVFSLDGKPIKTVKVGLVKQEVSQEDKDEYNEIQWLKNPFFKISFPDYKAYYTQIAPLADVGYFVFTISPFYRNVEGLVVDAEGKTLRRVKLQCGASGSLMGARGRLFGVFTDEYGEYSIRELKP